MKRQTLWGLLCPVLLLLTALPAAAQNKGTVKGRLVDAATTSPLAYASVRVLRLADSSTVGGALTDDKGNFTVSLPLGEFRAEVEFVGFKPHRTSGFSIGRGALSVDLGAIALAATATALSEIEVRADKSAMVLALDKRIFNVGKDLANAGGTASDILSNIPSVSVDAEGGIKLRGNDNVRILIDGKPSGLVSFKGGAGLQQLPANMIDRVEVITNPSARYEAEGSAGIINIVLKKDTRQGFNAAFEVVGGYPTNFGAAANLNYRHRKINFFINYGLAYRAAPGRGSQYQEYTNNDTLFLTQQRSTNVLEGLNNNIRGGLDYYFTEKSIVTASYLWRRSDAFRVTDIVYNDYRETPANFLGRTTRRQEETEDEPNSEISLIYKKKFTREGHELTAEAKYLNYWERSDQLFTQQTFWPTGQENTALAQLQTSLNDEYENQYLLQLDYIRPFGKDGKVEMGLRTSFRDMVNDYVVKNKDLATGIFTPILGLDNYFIYQENISGAYGMYGNKKQKFSWQLGLRAEYTDVATILRETNERNPRDYFNLFPSAHFTYDLPQQNALQLSYSRRVRRPVYNDLTPFVTFSDNRNFFSGSPDLDPEYSDVFDLGHIKYFDKGSLTSSVYFRNTTEKIERIRRVDERGFAATRPENLLFERAWGIDVASGYALFKWWKLDLNANFFYASIDGSNVDAQFRTTTYSWFARQTSKFSLPKNLDIQLRGNYEARQKTAQGERKALYFIDLAASKDLLGRKATLTLSIIDLLNSRRFRFINTGTNFYTSGDSQRQLRQINLTFSYRIRQNKSAKKLIGDE